MATNTLTEERRTQLDNIVSRMEANGETKESIIFVVDDFKKKYGDGKSVDVDNNNSETESKTEKIGGLAGSVVGRGIGSAFGPVGGVLGSEIGKRTGKSVARSPKQSAVGVFDALPMVGGVSGALAGSGVGSIPLAMLMTAGGEGIRQVGRRALGVNPTPPVESGIPGLTISRIPGVSSEISNILEQGALSGLIDTASLGAGKAVKATSPIFRSLQAKSAGSAMGGMKNVYNKVRGGSKAFNKAAVEMQERGAFGAFSSPESMLSVVKDEGKRSGSRIGEIIKEVSGQDLLIDSQKLAQSIYNDLKTPIASGYGNKINREAKVIADTITGIGDQVKISDLQEIKKIIDPGKWGDFQMSNIGKDARKVYDMRQKAYSKISDVIEEGIDLAEQSMITQGQRPDLPQLGFGNYVPDKKRGLLDEFKKAKQTYGASETVRKGLQDKIDRMEGRQFLGLGEIGSTVGALMNLFGGNPAAAAKWLATAAGIKYLRSFGPQQGAIIFKTLSQLKPNTSAMASVLRAGQSAVNRNGGSDRDQ